MKALSKRWRHYQLPSRNVPCDFIDTFSHHSFTGDRCCVQRRAGVVSWYLAAVPYLLISCGCCQYTELCGVNATVKWGECFVCGHNNNISAEEGHTVQAGAPFACEPWSDAKQRIGNHWTRTEHYSFQCSSSTEMCLQAADWNLSKCGGLWISKCYLFITNLITSGAVSIIHSSPLW